jgi:hypothetical protein
MEVENNCKLEHRAVIKFLILEQVQAKEIFERMSAVYGTEYPSYATVKRWAAEFKRGNNRSVTTHAQDAQQKAALTKMFKVSGN